MEIFSYKELMYRNTITQVKALVDASIRGNVTLDRKSEMAKNRIFKWDLMSNSLTQNSSLLNEMKNDIKLLWNSTAMKTLFEKDTDSVLYTDTTYFLDNIDRIFNESYVPDYGDIIHSRVKTTGIIEEIFKTDSIEYFKIVDLGGARSERKKWNCVLENCSAVFYFVALDSYNKCLEEENFVNALQESLKLFQTIVNSTQLSDTDFFLFFNKMDQFERKFPHNSLKDNFPDFAGETAQQGMEFIATIFLDKIPKSPFRRVHHYFTNTHDIQSTQAVLKKTIKCVEQHYIQKKEKSALNI